jgi:hypothetical protein
MKADQFAALLQNVTTARKRGKTEYLATCPGCRCRSLSFKDGKSGLAWMCHPAIGGGCEVPAILGPLGLEWQDLAEPMVPRELRRAIDEAGAQAGVGPRKKRQP